MNHFFTSLFRSSQAIFPRVEDKLLLALLTCAGALISISELGIAKIFTEIVVEERPATFAPLALIATFLVLSLLARLSHYYQRTQRVRLFSKSILATNFKNKENSWDYSLAMEISNIFSHLFQVMIIITFLIYLSFQIGLLTFFASLSILVVFGALFTKQEEFQKQAFRAKFIKEKISTESRVFSRVKSGELGALVSGVITVALLLFLLIGHELNLISTAGAVVSFFAIRLLGTNLNSLSTAAMRYARALVNSSISTVKDTKNSSKNESLSEWDEA